MANIGRDGEEWALLNLLAQDALLMNKYGTDQVRRKTMNTFDHETGGGDKVRLAVRVLSRKTNLIKTKEKDSFINTIDKKICFSFLRKGIPYIDSLRDYVQRVTFYFFVIGLCFVASLKIYE